MDPSLVALLPAHGLCLTSIPSIITVTALLNLVIAGSYVTLSGVLYCLSVKLKKVPYVRTFIWLWIAFVFLCGLTHLSKTILLFQGGMMYYLDVIVHGMTAIVS